MSSPPLTSHPILVGHKHSWIRPGEQPLSWLDIDLGHLGGSEILTASTYVQHEQISWYHQLWLNYVALSLLVLLDSLHRNRTWLSGCKLSGQIEPRCAKCLDTPQLLGLLLIPRPSEDPEVWLGSIVPFHFQDLILAFPKIKHDKAMKNKDSNQKNTNEKLNPWKIHQKQMDWNWTILEGRLKHHIVCSQATQLRMVHHMRMIRHRLSSISGFPAQGVAGHWVWDLTQKLWLKEPTVQGRQGQAQDLKATAVSLVNFHLENRTFGNLGPTKA